MMKNRNALLWILPLIYAAWSCSDNMVDEDNVVVSPIVFAVDDVSTTRAEIIPHRDSLRKKGFTVYASYQVNGDRDTNNFFIRPCKVAYIGTEWLTEQTYYWPLTDTVSFYAYAPYDTINVITSKSDLLATDPKITYKVNKNVKKQTDLLWSNAQNNRTLKNNNKGQTLQFRFGHALSQLAFEVTNHSGQAISINRLSMSGTFCAQAKMNVKQNETWGSEQKDTATYVIDLKKTSLANGETTSNADDSYLMIIPYTCTDLSIKISFVYQGTTYTDSTATFSATFVKANSYKYNIEIQDLSGLSTQAVAAPEVRQWE
jgi:hypothetical protein